MKIKNIVLSVVVFFAVCSCTFKFEEAGDLPGMWQLLTVERKGVVTDVKAKKIYWKERLGLVQFDSTDIPLHSLYCHLQNTGSMFVMTDFCYPSAYVSESDDNTWIPFNERDVLFPWGIYAMEEDGGTKVKCEFKVECLNADKMVLQSDSARLVFRKF